MRIDRVPDQPSWRSFGIGFYDTALYDDKQTLLRSETGIVQPLAALATPGLICNFSNTQEHHSQHTFNYLIKDDNNHQIVLR
jgi:hypothetical protein